MIRTIVKDYEEELTVGGIAYCKQTTLAKEAIDWLKKGELVTIKTLEDKLNCTETAAWAVMGMLYHYNCIELVDTKWYFCVPTELKEPKQNELREPCDYNDKYKARVKYDYSKNDACDYETVYDYDTHGKKHSQKILFKK